MGSHVAAPGEQFGGSVPCSRVSPQSWYWRWREHLLFTPPTDNPCRTWESNLQPLGYKSNSLTIRPRLPRCDVWDGEILHSSHTHTDGVHLPTFLLRLTWGFCRDSWFALVFIDGRTGVRISLQRSVSVSVSTVCCNAHIYKWRPYLQLGEWMLIRNLYERRLSDSCSGSRVHCEHLCLSNLCDEPIMKPTNEEPQILCILSVTYL